MPASDPGEKRPEREFLRIESVQSAGSSGRRFVYFINANPMSAELSVLRKNKGCHDHLPRQATAGDAP
jgi:hypothetical protein